MEQNNNKENLVGGSVFPTRTKTIKVEIRTWDSLKNLKKENETFDDVIKYLLRERTVSAGNNNLMAIKYERKVAFFNMFESNETIGYEFEYNDVKGSRADFVLDLKIKKVFYKKRVLNPSEYFGVDNSHKHYSDAFLSAYLKAMALAFKKEFRFEIIIADKDGYENMAKWRQFYYEYSLSEESFKQDIEEPLRLSGEEKPSKEWQERIDNSISKMNRTAFE